MIQPVKLYSIIIITLVLAACNKGGGGGSRRPAPNHGFVDPGFDGGFNDGFHDINSDDDYRDSFRGRDSRVWEDCHGEDLCDGPMIGTPHSQTIQTLPGDIDPGPIEVPASDWETPVLPPIFYRNTPTGIEILRGNSPEEVGQYLGDRQTGVKPADVPGNELHPGDASQPIEQQQIAPSRRRRRTQAPVPVVNAAAASDATNSATTATDPAATAPGITVRDAATPAAQAAPQVLPTKIFAAEDENWRPGVATEPLRTEAEQKSMWTNGVNGENVRFTDARNDTLMYHIRSKHAVLDEKTKASSTELAKRVGHVTFRAPQAGNKHATLDVRFHNGDNVVQVLFGGETSKKDNRVFVMKQSGEADQGFHYKALARCVDLTSAKGTCENAVIEVNRYQGAVSAAQKAEPIASVFIVYRQGLARLTTADIYSTNENYREFNEFLNATKFNACIALKDRVSGSLKASLEVECPGVELKANGGSEAVLKSWAVAEGRSAFTLVFGKNAVNSKSFELSGELLLSERPIAVKVHDESGRGLQDKVEQAVLRANDASGNLNIILTFKGSPAAEMRFSVTSVVTDTITAPEAKAKVKVLAAPAQKSKQSTKTAQKTNAAAADKTKKQSKTKTANVAPGKRAS